MFDSQQQEMEYYLQAGDLLVMPNSSCTLLPKQGFAKVDKAETEPNTNITHPGLGMNLLCAGMFVMNLVQPLWISVECNRNITTAVYCLVEDVSSNTDSETEKPRLSVCFLNELLLEKKCLAFLWLDYKTASQSHSEIALQEISRISVFFFAVREIFPPVFLFRNNQTIIFHKCASSQKSQVNQITSDSVYALHITVRNSHLFETYGNSFKCDEDIFISTVQVCDGKIDCPQNGTDEIGCECRNQEEFSQKCKYLINNDGAKSCSAFYLRFHSSECQHITLSTQGNVGLPVKNSSFYCSSGVLLSSSLVNDLVADCGASAEDEMFGRQTSGRDFCAAKGQLSCRFGYSKCYNISEICSFRLNTFGLLHPCRTGDHIQNCKAFECNVMFKCPNYYCIPWSYVCDRKWDCPGGFDESVAILCREKRFCRSMFKCHMHQVCVHLSNLCDSISDCPLDEDESFCELSNAHCPEGCHCLLYSIVCSKIALPLSDSLPHTFLFIEKAEVKYHNMDFSFVNAVSLSVTKSDLVDVCSFVLTVPDVLALDVSENKIDAIRAGCFQTSDRVAIIRLNDNAITSISKHGFHELLFLTFLNLTGNCLVSLRINMFGSTGNLSMLSLEQRSLINVDVTLFEKLQITFLETKNYKLCCTLPEAAQCTVGIPWHVTCSHMLPDNLIRTLFLSTPLAIIICCAISILIHASLSKGLNNCLKKLGAYETTVVSINVSDVLCATSLLTLFATDLYFSNSFFWEQEEWKSSPVCFTNFGMIQGFTWLSCSLLGFMSCSRVLVVVFPMKRTYTKAYFTTKFIIFTYTGTLLCAAGVTFAVHQLLSSVPTSLCSPFLDPLHSATIISVLVWLFVFLHSLSILVIISAHIFLLFSLNKSQQDIKHAASKAQSNLSLILQISIMTASNILCWVPSGAIYLSSMFVEQYSVSVVMWNAVAIAPINSIVNPSVFVATAIRKLLRSKKTREQYKRKVSDKRNVSCSVSGGTY